MRDLWEISIKKPCKYLEYISTIIKLLYVPINIIVANLIANIVNNATKANLQLVLKNSLILILVVLFSIIIKIFINIKYEIKKTEKINKMKLQIYEKLLNQEVHKLYSFKQGELIEIFNKDFKNIIEMSTNIKPSFYSAIISILIYTIILFIKNPIISITLILLSLVQIIAPLIVTKFLEQNYEKNRIIESLITEYIISGYKGFTTIKYYNLKSWFLKGFQDLDQKYLKVGSKSEMTACLEEIISLAIQNTLKYGTYIIMGLFILYTSLTLDIAIETIALSTSFYIYVKEVFDIIPKLVINKLAKSKFSNWFEYQYLESNNIITFKKLKFENVSYKWNEKQILHNCFITFSTDEIILIKGENGIGKSTFFKLIVGLIKPSNGNILINNINIESISENQLLENIFYMPQDDTNFNFTLEELVKLNLQYSIRKIEQICLKLGLVKENIYNYKISELSGGQRKKAFLAIALSLNDTFVLLDEPTNYLDIDSQQVLIQLLKERKKGAIIITHDLIFNNIAHKSYKLINGGFEVE